MRKKLFADVVGTTRLDIPEYGVWVEVRNELSIGEQRRAFAGAIKGSTPIEDGKTRMEYDGERVSFAITASYIVDWSLVDANDKRVPYSLDALKALTPDAYSAIEKAVDAYTTAAKGKVEKESASGAALISDSAA